MTVLPGLRVRQLGQGLRRLRVPARHGNAPHGAVDRPDGARHVRPVRRRRRRTHRGLSPSDPAAPDRARPRRWSRGDDGLGARVLRVPRELRRGGGEGLRRSQTAERLHPRLPHPPDDEGRVPHPRDPQRPRRRRDPGRVLEGRSRSRPARDQLALRRRAHDGRPPCDLQERCEGDRRGPRSVDLVHGEVRHRPRRIVLPHPFVVVVGRRRPPHSWRIPTPPTG